MIFCEYCNIDDGRAVYAHNADEVCGRCLVVMFGISQGQIDSAPESKPVGATYQDVWLLKSEEKQ